MADNTDRLFEKTRWFSEAKYNLGERKHSNHGKAGPYIKNQATRNARRNTKRVIDFELRTSVNA